MITIANKLPDTCNNANAAYAKICCNFAAYGNNDKIALFWVQTDKNENVTAVISMIDGDMCIFFNNGDKDELKSFINAISPSTIFTDLSTAKILNLKIDKICDTLIFHPPFDNGSGIDNTYSGIDYVYNLLSKRLKITNRDAFIADLSHRLRHSCAEYVTSRYTAAVLLYSKNYAIITGIAVTNEKSGCGLGAATVRRLLYTARNRTVFVCAEEGTTPFYLKNGFTIDNKAAYCHI